MAMGAPTLSLVRDHVGLQEWMPAGERHRQLVAACRCLQENRTDCLAAGKASCLASITAEQAAGEALRQLR
jgi:hypothetical protein